MQLRSLSVILGALGCAASAGHRPEATGACRPPDALSRLALAHVVGVASRTAEPWPALRERLQLTWVPPDSIALVRDPALCARAQSAVARDAEAAPGAEGPRVYVFRVGRRYIAVDPEVRAGEWTPGYVLDERLTIVERVLF